jgi:GT2 family glycosyltransferase
MDLSIIVVSYKAKEKLRVTLASVFASKVNFHYELINVDNDSRDGTAEMVQKEFPGVKLLHNENKGFAHGNNVGIKHSQARYILLLNPDTELMPETLQECYEVMEARKEIGAMTCKLVKGDGKMDLACRRSFPNHWQALSRFLNLSFFFPKSKMFAKYNLTFLDENQEAYVDAISGAFFWVRKEVVSEVGLLDEDFFMYNEDFDWCYRIKEAGWKILFYPKVICYHYKGSSSRKTPFKSLYAFADSIWIFYRKHYAQKYPFFLNWLVYLGIWFRFGILATINYFRSPANRYVSK